MVPEIDTNRSYLSPRRKFRKILGAFFYTIFLLSVCVGIIGLAVLLFDVLTKGIPWLSWHFITEYPSRHPEETGSTKSDAENGTQPPAVSSARSPTLRPMPVAAHARLRPNARPSGQ